MAMQSGSSKTLSATALISFAQAAIGCGAGLLLAGKLGRKAQRITALVLVGAGAAAAIPAVVDSVSTHLNQTARGQRRRLDSIRQDAGFPEDADVY
ncbi:MAG: hypothetical protein QM796_00770 [Chthoniobacteraceae bacterium]